MITTHVLDVSQGTPAVGVTVILEVRQASEWAPVGRGVTDEKGRVTSLTEGWPVSPGTYRLTFDLASYQRSQGVDESFFPEAKVAFNISDVDQHYHVPLLISPFGYTTYRGA